MNDAAQRIKLKAEQQWQEPLDCLSGIAARINFDRIAAFMLGGRRHAAKLTVHVQLDRPSNRGIFAWTYDQHEPILKGTFSEAEFAAALEPAEQAAAAGGLRAAPAYLIYSNSGSMGLSAKRYAHALTVSIHGARAFEHVSFGAKRSSIIKAQTFLPKLGRPKSAWRYLFDDAPGLSRQ